MIVYARDKSIKLPKRKPKRNPRYGDKFPQRPAPEAWTHPNFTRYFKLEDVP